VQLDVTPQLEAVDHVEELLQHDALAVEQQLVAEVEDPQVAEHLALVREEGGVTAAARFEAEDVVGDLAVQEVLGLRAGQGELAALGAIDDERGH
jgi:hypothetical protein